jgi:hypothetical protein
MLSSNVVYQVNAVVEGRNLDEYAIVGIDSRIRPYFLSSIKNDPDVTGLVVFLKTPRGEVVSKKVRYVPGSAGRGSGQPINIDKDKDLQGIDTTVPASGSGSTETPAEQTESGQSASGEDASGSAGSEENSRNETLPPNEEYAGDGSSKDEEYADAGKDFSAGTTADDSWDTGPVYQIRQMKTPSGFREVADPDELVVYVQDLSEDMPALLFPEELTIGIYILVFQVLGPQGILSSSEKLAYYVADTEFSMGDIQAYHSGDMEKFGIVSPGSVIMLETRVNADARLRPYIVWYSGKQRVREGPVSDGVDRLLWQAPGKTGFQAIRAEVFPFTPPESYKKTAGLAKELSLAISSKQTNRAAGNVPQQNALTRWYQLGGDFSDSLASADAGRKLTPGNGAPGTWLPKAGIYGLAAGSAASYTIPGPLFIPDKELPGRGQLVFRLALQSSGTVFSGIFVLDRTSQTLKLDLSWDAAAGRLILRYALNHEEEIQNLSLPSSAGDGWITVTVDFIAKRNKFWAELGLLSDGSDKFPAELVSLSGKSVPSGRGIVLPGALTGYGVFKLGALSALSALSSTTLSPVSPSSSSSASAVSSGLSSSSTTSTVSSPVSPSSSSSASAVSSGLSASSTTSTASSSVSPSSSSSSSTTSTGSSSVLPPSSSPVSSPAVASSGLSSSSTTSTASSSSEALSSTAPAPSSSFSSSSSPASPAAASTPVKTGQVNAGDSAIVMIVDAVLVLFSADELFDESGEEPPETEDEESISKDAPDDASSGVPDTRAVPVRVERRQELPVEANTAAKPGTEKDAKQSPAGEKPSRTPYPTAGGDNGSGASGEAAVSPGREPGKEPPVSPVEEVSAEEDGVSAPGEKDTDLTRETEDGETPDIYNTEALTLLGSEL